MPSIKTDVQLAEEDWYEVGRTELALAARLRLKRERNEMYKRAAALKKAGRALTVSGTNQVDQPALPEITMRKAPEGDE